MLELRPNCECCDRDLPPESPDAVICTYECTWCRTCAEDVLHGRLPQLRRWPRAAPDPAGGRPAEGPGLDDAGPAGAPSARPGY